MSNMIIHDATNTHIRYTCFSEYWTLWHYYEWGKAVLQMEGVSKGAYLLSTISYTSICINDYIRANQWNSSLTHALIAAAV